MQRPEVEPIRRPQTAGALLLCLSAALVLLGGCGPVSTEEPSSPSSGRGEAGEAGSIPEVARIVCGRDGTLVSTPRVRARPDGVRFVIVNRFEAETGYSFEYPEGGGGGDNAPEGESGHVGDFPPGEVRIGCEEPPADGIRIDYEKLQVTDPGGFYKAVGLECRGGEGAVGSAGGRPGEDPVELARRVLSDRLEDYDVVELAGYPKSPERRTVRVVRDGRITATIEFLRERDGWRASSVSNYAGF